MPLVPAKTVDLTEFSKFFNKEIDELKNKKGYLNRHIQVVLLD